MKYLNNEKSFEYDECIINIEEGDELEFGGGDNLCGRVVGMDWRWLGGFRFGYMCVRVVLRLIMRVKRD